MKQHNVVRWAASLGLALTCTGCATIAGGSREQKVAINSKPRGAQVYVDGQPAGTTPTEVSMSRKTDHDVVIEQPGYLPYHTQVKSGLNPWVFGNLALGGVLGLAVDMGCDSCHRLWPGSVESDLNPMTNRPGSAPLAN